jgi:pimeloyl-ACP methyl ester carboxylesterase
MPYLSVADAQLCYQEHGAGDPLILVHGFTLAGEIWADVVPILAERHRVIVPDLRGHGRSRCAPETIRHDRFAADMIALLDHLDIGRAHFVGYSSGAVCGLFVGTQHLERLRTLTLVGGTYTFDEHYRAEARRTVAECEADPAWIDLQRRRHGAAHGPDHWRVLLDRWLAWANGPGEVRFRPADLTAITCPTLVLHGDRDPFFPVHIATTMYEAMPNAELAIVAAASNDAGRQERTDLFVRIVTDFHRRHIGA